MTGPELRKEREEAGVSRKRLARAILRDNVTLWRWENMLEVPPASVVEYRAGIARLTEEERIA